MSRILRVGLVAAAVAVVLVAAAELVARWALPADPHGEARVSLTNQVPGFEPVSEVSLSGQGLRPADWRRRVGEPRILCLGADNSFHLLQGDRREWWGQLEQALRQGGGKARTVALGGQGMTLVDVAAWLENFEPDLGEFDAVVILAGASEVRARGPQADLSVDAPGVNAFRTRGGWRGSLVKHSGLARALRNSRGGLQQAFQASLGPATEPNALAKGLAETREQLRRVRMNPPESWRVPYLQVAGFEQDEPGLVRALAAQAEKGLERIDVVCDRAGLPWLMVFEPTLEDRQLTPTEIRSMIAVENLGEAGGRVIDPYWVDSAFTRLAAGLQEKTAQRGGQFVNLRGVVPADLTHFYTERMLTDAGAKALGAVLAGPVRQLLAQQPVTQPEPAAVVAPVKTEAAAGR